MLRIFNYLITPFEPKLVFIIFKNLIRNSKITQHLTVTKINWLLALKETVTILIEQHEKPFNTKSRVAGY
jgi:hypothetical protein